MEAAQLKPLIDSLRIRIASANGQCFSIPDMGPVAGKAITAARIAAADKFGAEAAKKADISADSGFRDLTDRIWLCGGLYIGEDEQGKRFFARWKAVMYYLDGPQCFSITFEDPSHEPCSARYTCVAGDAEIWPVASS